MKESTLDIWKKLQEEGYFEKHPLYKNFHKNIPNCVDFCDINNKNVCVIGSGYGKQSWFFAEHSKKLYLIDVSEKILNICKEFIDKKEKNISYILAEEYKNKIINNIDFVYCLHVIQHITEEQTKEYIDFFYNKLNVGGTFLAQFYIGTDKIIEENKEPKIQYTKEEALCLFSKYKIDKTWTLQKFDANNNLQYEHFYVIARKTNE